ncbi:MAG: NAD-dependent epimerase/dehydratase family protein [Candidatus Odinarchaeota archaeon]
MSTISGSIEGKNILILGGLGFIGSNLAQTLCRYDCTITIFDALIEGLGGNLANIKEIKDEVQLVKGDIRDFALVEQHVRDKDIIFNCAGQTDHVRSMKEPFLDIDINCRGIMNVLEAVRTVNDSAKIVFTGTRSQFSKMVYSPFDEDHPEFPSDIYSANRSVGEKYHLIYYRAHGIKSTSLRLTNIYGPRSPISHGGHNVINFFVRLAITDQTIPIYQPGQQKRDILFIEDAVDSLIGAAITDRSDGEVFIVGSGKPVPLIDIAKMIVNYAGSGEVTLVPWPENRKKIEVGDVVLNIDKIKKILGWNPRTNFEEGIKKTISFYRGRLNEYI